MLRVINRSKSALVCRTWVLSDQEPILAYPVLFEVAPYCTSSTEVPVWPRDFPAFERAIAEVVGDGVHCIVEAAAPPQYKRARTHALVASALLAAGVLSVALAAMLSAALPRIAAFAVAPQAIAGTTVEAEYSVSGVGRLSYLVTAADGRRIAGGPLLQGAGSIFIPIPASAQTGPYAIRLGMQGPLGGTSDTRIVNPVQSAGQSAHISDVSVHPMIAKPGELVEVSYSATGDGGYVRLEGTDGTVWSEQPFSSSGQAKLVVPPFAEGRELHVALHVTKGNSVAESEAGLLVAAASKPAAAAAAAIAGDDSSGDPAALSNDAPNGTFEVASTSVRSGAPIVVRILSPRNDMRISLYDPASHEVTGISAGADAETVTLRAPSVSLATRYTVVASFTDGFGQETIVQPITILP